MPAASYTLSAMKTIVTMKVDEAKKLAPRAGMKKADLLYMADVLESTLVVLDWLVEYQAAIEKAAKNNVPWRKKQ